MKPMKPITMSFTGVVSGDGECFAWDDVQTESPELMDQMKENDRPKGRLYPNDLCWAAGIEDPRRYRYTVTVEPIESGAKP